MPVRQPKKLAGATKAKAKLKYSRYLITVNPNRKTGTFPGGEKGLRTRLALCARILRQDKLKPYVYLLKKEHSYEKNVVSVEVDADVEKGSARGFLHTHILLSIKHTTSLRLSYPVVRAAFAKILGLEKVHFDAKLIKGGETIEQVRAYVHKNNSSTSGGGDDELEVA